MPLRPSKKPLNKSNKKKTSGSIFSITIRLGEEIHLGNKWISALEDWFLDHSTYRVLSIEKFQQDDEPLAGHFQGAIYLESPQRQDNIRRSLLALVEKYRVEPLTANQKKYGIEVRVHNNWELLIAYCMKEVVSTVPTGVNLLCFTQDKRSYKYYRNHWLDANQCECECCELWFKDSPKNSRYLALCAKYPELYDPDLDRSDYLAPRQFTD